MTGSPMRHHYVPFSEDLHQQVWQSLKEPTCVVFAHEGQKKFFISTYQDDIELTKHNLLSMDEFMQKQLQIDAPIVSPDQRWLFIAKSMTDTHRRSLAIHSNRAAWSFARLLYPVWVAAWEAGQTLNEGDEIWDDWQRPWVKICTEILANYKKNLTRLGYTDTIFLKVNPRSGSLVLANILILPPTLRRLIKSWTGDVTFFHQGPEGWFAKTTGELRPLAEWTNKVGQVRTKRVDEYVVSTQSQEQQVIETLSHPTAPPTHLPIYSSTIIDPRQRPLWLARTNVSMTRTSLYQFLNTWLTIFAEGNLTRLPMSLVRTLIFNKAFALVYAWPDDLIDRFWKATKDGIRWWDIKDLASTAMTADHAVLKRFDVKTWEMFIGRFPLELWEEDGLDEIRYQFGSVWESLKLSVQAQLIPDGAALEYVVDRLSRRVVKVVGSSLTKVRRPLDSLNVVESPRCFSGVMEGLVPPTAQTPWLFTPRQMVAFEMATPMLKQSIEAYAWVQALLTTETASIVVYHNGQDMRPPSLWNWLREHLPVRSKMLEGVISSVVEKSELHGLCETTDPSISVGMTAHFLRGLPIKLKEFGIDKLSYSAYDMWRTCPYKYSLSKGYHVKISDLSTLGTVDPAFMGRLANDWLGTVMVEVAKDISAWELFNGPILLSMAKQAWASKRRHWPIALEGLIEEKIVLPDLVDMAKGLLHCIDQEVGIQNIKALLPETQEDQPQPYSDDIVLSGRADLLLETKSGDCWVIDYKTGTETDALQLNWYAWLYYKDRDAVKLAFYNVPDRRLDVKKTDLASLKDAVESWQGAQTVPAQVHADKASGCQYCPYGELCRK